MLKNNYVELEKKRDNAINNLIKMLNQCTLKKVDNVNLSNEKPYSLDTIEYEHSTKTSYYFDLPPKKNTYLIGLSEQKKSTTKLIIFLEIKHITLVRKTKQRLQVIMKLMNSVKFLKYLKGKTLTIFQL